MIVLYYNLSSSSCRRALDWFRSHGIEIRKERINNISRESLIQALTLTENGFSDLLKNKGNNQGKVQCMISDVQSMTFNEGISFILRHPELLKVPLTISENKLAVGYNAENLRVFISKKYRDIGRLK